MREVFTWPPLSSVELSEEPNVNRTSFGEGYEVRIEVGINCNPAKWAVRFSETPTRDVLNFLRAHKAKDSFIWTDPFGATGFYVARTWKSTHLGGGRYEVSTQFDQVFEA